MFPNRRGCVPQHIILFYSNETHQPNQASHQKSYDELLSTWLQHNNIETQSLRSLDSIGTVVKIPKMKIINRTNSIKAIASKSTPKYGTTPTWID
jgi:hypothetical protein